MRSLMYHKLADIASERARYHNGHVAEIWLGYGPDISRHVHSLGLTRSLADACRLRRKAYAVAVAEGKP